MKTPRKLYVVVSRREQDDLHPWVDVFVSCAKAKREAAERNRLAENGVDDWRIETFVKGD